MFTILICMYGTHYRVPYGNDVDEVGEMYTQI